ncbi:MAG: ATP synthase F1 subunit epsilon [Planctomycetaceae bacterium]|nr:ATP synthase F1 subunit epsilon [Planctomycetaceae bacterium]
MIAPNFIELEVVTPEKTLLTVLATSLQFPLEDGQIGILIGRAPMVGRLGMGELIITTPEGTSRYFIDGGFVQVKDSVVTLLTNHAAKLSDLNANSIESTFNEIQQLSTSDPKAFQARNQELERCRKMLSILKR